MFELSPEEAVLIEAYATSGMCRNRAAKKIPASFMYVRWNLDKIHAKTGLDPRRFEDLQKLYAAAKEVLDEADS